MAKKIKGVDLGDFVDKLLEEKKLPSDLDKDVLFEMKNDLLKRVDNRINATILANLNEEQINVFSELLDGDDEKKIQAFLEDAIPDLAEVIASELITFRQTYLA